MKLVIQLWQTGAHDPQHGATPFMIAASAAAMDVEVSIHALGASVELFQQTNTARHTPVAPLERPLSAYVEDALRSGVQIALCSTAMRDRGLTAADMIAEAQDVIGMVTMLEVSLDPNCKVLVY